MSIDFQGKGLIHFRNMYRESFCAAGWLIQSNCQARNLPTSHNITDIFVGFYNIADRYYLEKAIYLYIDVGFFHQFDRNLCISIFQTSFFFFNEQWQTRQWKGGLFTHTICF